MSPVIDERIVEMQFNNQRFENNISTSISSLDKLKTALKFDNATKSLDSIEKKFDSLDLSGIGSAIEVISSRFSTLGVIGTTILQDIAHRAFQAGQQILGMVKSMTISQIGAGWDKYAEKTTSVQTIMAATGQTWKNDADYISQLNAVINSGFDSSKAATYFQTWKDVNSGLVSANDAAKQLGITTKEFADITSSFSNYNGIQYQGSQMDYVNDQMRKLNWFTDETSYNFTDMVNNIGKFTANNIPLSQATTAMQGIANWAAISGQNAAAASRAMYNMAQAIGVGSVKLMDWKSIENANMATAEFKQQVIETAVANGQLSATVDKTGKTIYKTASGLEVTAQNFSQTLSAGWFDSKTLLGTLEKYGAFTDKLYDFSEASDLTATEILNLIDAQEKGSITQAQYEEIAKDSGLTVDELKTKLKELGSEEFEFGRKTFKAAQEAKTFADAIDATKDAASTKWMNIFENIFGDYEKAKKLWTGFAEFLYDTLVSPLEKLEDLSKVLGELNAVNRIARGFGYIFSFLNGGDGIETFSILGSIAKGFREIFPPVENLKLAISQVLTAFTRWGKSIQLTREQSVALTSAARGLARIFKIGILDSVVNLWKATEPLRKSLGTLASSLVSLFIKFGRAGNGMHITALSGEFLSSVCEKLASIIDKVSEAIDNVDIADIREKFNGFADAVSNVKDRVTEFFSNITSFSFGNTFGSAIDFVKNKFEELKKLLSGFNIGAALMGGAGVGAGALLGAGIIKLVKLIKNPLKALDGIKEKIEGLFDSIGKLLGKTDFDSATEGLKKIATSILILAAALLVLGFVDYDNAIIGIGIIGTALAAFFMNLKAFEKVKASSIAKLAGIMIALSASMLVFAIALAALAGAVALFALVAKMDSVWKGVGVMAASLGILCVAMFALSKISPKVFIGAAALMVLATALIVLAGAMALFAVVAKMDTVWKGLGLMAASLGVLIVALLALSLISPMMLVGAASIMVLSASLMVLAGAIALFGVIAGMSNIWNGVALMAGALGVLTLALIALGAAGPAVLAGSAAILILAGALLVLSGVMAAFAAIAMMQSAWEGLGLLAAMIGVLVIALLALSPAALGVLGAAAALLVVAGACLVLAVAVGVVSAALPLLGLGLAALATGVSAGLTSLGDGIASFGGGVGTLISSVMSSVALGVEELVSSIGKGIADGVDAISSSISNFSTSLSDVGSGITDFGNGIRSLDGISWLKTAAGIGEISVALKGLNADGLGTSVSDAANGVVTACTSMVTSLQNAVQSAASFTLSGGRQIALNMASGINSKIGNARSAGTAVSNAAATGLRAASSSSYTIGANAGQGFVNGVLSKELQAGEAGKKIADAALKKAMETLAVKSPSREFFKIGDYATQGFINGILSLEGGVEDASETISQSAISSVADAMANIVELMDNNPEIAPVIRPVLDSKSFESDMRNLRSNSDLNTDLSAKNSINIQNGSSLLSNAVSNVNSGNEHAESIKFTAQDAAEFIDIGNTIINYLKEGHDLYFDDGVLAGRINRRLGSL